MEVIFNDACDNISLTLKKALSETVKECGILKKELAALMKDEKYEKEVLTVILSVIKDTLQEVNEN